MDEQLPSLPDDKSSEKQITHEKMEENKAEVVSDTKSARRETKEEVETTPKDEEIKKEDEKPDVIGAAEEDSQGLCHPCMLSRNLTPMCVEWIDFDNVYYQCV